MKDKNVLIDFTDEELHDALRNSAEHVAFSYKNYRDELFRRTQDRNTKALNRWTVVIAIATLLNTLAAIIALAKSFEWLK